MPTELEPLPRPPRRAAVGCSLALWALGLAAGCAERGPIELDRFDRRRAGNLEIVDAHLSRTFGDGGRMIALFVDPKLVEPTLLINAEERELDELAPGATAVVNAGFFTPERRATGLLISRGKVLSPFVREAGSAGSGVFVVEKGSAELVRRDDFARARQGALSFAIQAGPRIIEPGGKDGIRSDDGARANRTVIGRDRRGKLALVVFVGASGWQSGPTLFEVQRLLGPTGLGRIDPGLTLEHALNLDGGPSTGLHLRLDEQPIDLPESAPVLSVLALGARP